jgi:hypothetical protein
MTKEVSSYVDSIISDSRVSKEIYETLIRGAINSSETAEGDSEINKWFNQRFRPNSIILDKDDYSRALIRSLWIAPNLASLDFSGGRLRDFAQLWTDTARGFLGEIAVQKFLKLNFNFDVYLETKRGKVEEFMSSDILVIEKGSKTPRKSNLRFSIKTSKFNGRWLEIPESQFKQSDVFVLVKLGISRYHFSAYLKTLKTIEQLFKKGVELHELGEDQIKILSAEIPEWMPIPAYIAGFVDKTELKLPIHNVTFSVKKKRELGTKRDTWPVKQISIEGGIGLFSNDNLKEFPELKALGLASTVPMEIAGINKEVDGKFYASTGFLKFKKEGWAELVKKL